MSENAVPERAIPDGASVSEPHQPRAVRLGVDGWANLLVGIVVVLAIANVLPKIPW
jgi:hypothetical protein